MQFDPRTRGQKENGQLLGRIVTPRPIAWVSTVGENGVFNLAPFSYYTAVCNQPPTICLSFSRRSGQKKDTLRNIEYTGDFVVNAVDERLAPAMTQTIPGYAPEVSEFEVAGVTPVASTVVRSPRVAESPLSMECRLTQRMEIGADDARCTLVIAEVVQFHVRDDLYREGEIDLARLEIIAQLAGDLYTRTTSTFVAPRPPEPKR